MSCMSYKSDLGSIFIINLTSVYIVFTSDHAITSAIHKCQWLVISLITTAWFSWNIIKNYIW